MQTRPHLGCCWWEESFSLQRERHWRSLTTVAKPSRPHSMPLTGVAVLSQFHGWGDRGPKIRRPWGLPKETHLGKKDTWVRGILGKKGVSVEHLRGIYPPAATTGFLRKRLWCSFVTTEAASRQGVDCCIFNWSPALSRIGALGCGIC